MDPRVDLTVTGNLLGNVKSAATGHLHPVPSTVSVHLLTREH